MATSTVIMVIATSTKAERWATDVPLPAIHPQITYGVANVIANSPKVFAYPHGTAVADGKIFIGMGANSGNPFRTNEVAIFGDADNISLPILESLTDGGDIETMAYDAKNDRVYFMLSNNEALDLYSLNPHTYAIYRIISTTTVDTDKKPAITTDGTYIYGITHTIPSKVFKVRISDGALTVSDKPHIDKGHSAAIGIFDGKEELYFAGGTSNGFEKVDPVSLDPIATIKVDPCGMSDDMPFVQTSPTGGYVYIGCELVPYGIRVDTQSMKYDRFSLPGGSLGLFSYGNDIYNATQDGYIDFFKNGDLDRLIRYKVASSTAIDSKGQDIEPNEIFYVPESNKLFFTAWFGIPGLFQISTSSQQ